MSFGNLVSQKFRDLVLVLESTRCPPPLDWEPPASSLEPKGGLSPVRGLPQYVHGRA